MIPSTSRPTPPRPTLPNSPTLAFKRSQGYSITKLVLILSAALPHLFNTLFVKASPLSLGGLGVGQGGTIWNQAGGEHNHDEPDTPPGSPAFWWKCALIVVLVLLGGVFAGLTLGLMGLDMVNLQVMATSGTDKERYHAERVLKLLEKGRHWVLVVLLLSNVITNESLPIFLDSVLGGGVAAIVISTALIVIFGEIIPQSVCVRYGLSIGSYCTPFVLALMYIEFPIAYPIAMLLDRVLGHDEGTTYRKAELKTFVSLHRHMGTDTLNEDEVTIISAVLELSEKSVRDIMTPIEDTYSLSSEQVLDEETVNEILVQGYSRVPVYEAGYPENFIGLLLIKKLITYDPEDGQKVGSFQLSTLFETSPETTCLDALNFFQQGRSHLLLVSEKPGESGGALGVVSLEDVVEELIGEEIIDETDVFVDIHNKIKVVRKAPVNRGGKGLGPLIREAMDRRLKRYGTINTVSTISQEDVEQGADGPTGRALDKIRVKASGKPAKRGRQQAGVAADDVLKEERNPKKQGSGAVVGSPGVADSSELNGGPDVDGEQDGDVQDDDERRPLVPKGQKK